VVAWAQQAIPVVGYLGSGSVGPQTNAFLQGLSDAGFVDGRNVIVEYRSAGGQYEQLPALAADLVRRQVTMIAVFGGVHAALAAKAATTTIPIVFAIGSDPVKFGLVGSLNRPSGNVRGSASSPPNSKRNDWICSIYYGGYRPVPWWVSGPY
jgi:putative ABC transport system substrate-binding protein